MRNWNDEIMKKKKKESRENATQLFSFRESRFRKSGRRFGDKEEIQMI